MNGFYFIYTEYMNGRVTIRDHPYYTLAEARRARKLKLKRLAGDPSIKAVKIGRQLGFADISKVDIKKII